MANNTWESKGQSGIQNRPTGTGLFGEIDITEVLFLIVENMRYIILAAVVCALGMAFYSKYMLTPMYSATTKLYLFDSNRATINMSDLQFGSFMAPDYMEIFKTRQLRDMVAEQLDVADLGSNFSVSVSNPSGTHLLYITVTCTSAEKARLLADAYADAAAEFIAVIMKAQEPNVFEQAATPTVPLANNFTRNVLIGLFAGAALVIVIIVLRSLLDDRIRSNEKIENKLGIPTLGMIPFQVMDEDKKPRKKKHHRAKED